MNSKILRIATRKSPLALWQANHIRNVLLKKHPHLTIELLPLITSGDQFLKDKLQSLGGKGLFVKELEEALLDKRADLAVHSTKDVPVNLPEGLHLAAICKRDNPLDAFVSTQFPTLDSLPHQALIGTASLRRQSQLLAHRPDLQIKTLRGNVNTRLKKLDSGEYQAIILAASGLERMGFNYRITELLSDEIMLPACGQGALSIECREDDLEVNTLVSELNDPVTASCVRAERLVNAELGGNCHVPLAVYCRLLDAKYLLLRAKVLKQDGTESIFNSQTGPIENPDEIAMRCSQTLLEKGAAQLLRLSE